MPERETSEKGITTSLAVGEGTIRDYHLTLMSERETSGKELPPHSPLEKGPQENVASG